MKQVENSKREASIIASSTQTACCTEVRNQETSADNECCHLTHHQHLEVWPWSHIAAPRPSLVGRLSDRIKFRLCVTIYKCVHGWHLVICQSCANQFLYFKDGVTCILPVAAILIFLVSDVPLTDNGRLSTLTHLLGTHYLMI